MWRGGMEAFRENVNEAAFSDTLLCRQRGLEAVLETILCFLVVLASVRPSLPPNFSLLWLISCLSTATLLPTTPRSSGSLSYRSLYVTSSLLRVCCLALTHHLSAWLRTFHLPPSAVNAQNTFFNFPINRVKMSSVYVTSNYKLKGTGLARFSFFELLSTNLQESGRRRVPIRSARRAPPDISGHVS